MTTFASAPGGRAASAPLLGHETEPTMFELSVPGRSSYQLRTTGVPSVPLDQLVPFEHLNADVINLAELSERANRTSGGRRPRRTSAPIRP